MTEFSHRFPVIPVADRSRPSSGQQGPSRREQRSPQPPHSSSRLPALPMALVAPVGRVEVLEGRVAQQEKTLGALLEQALRIRDEVALSLRTGGPWALGQAAAASSGAGWERERDARRMLEEHIRSIALIVHRLGREVEVLEAEVRMRDSTALGTSSAVKTLEMHHVTGVGDLRGRVARCDASIARLAGESRTLQDSLGGITRELTAARAALDLKLHEVEAQVGQVLARLEKESAEHEARLRLLQGECGHQVEMLDSRVKAGMEDLRAALNVAEHDGEHERQRVEHDVARQLQQLAGAVRERPEQVERRLQLQLQQVVSRLERLEEWRAGAERESAQAAQSAERLAARVTRHDKRRHDEVAALRAEYQAGFSAVHDSLSSLRAVHDARSRLEHESVAREVRRIRRMVDE
ncbi:unnamed protein product [Lampetra fluviatilis]